jgi:hypothetical protein
VIDRIDAEEMGMPSSLAESPRRPAPHPSEWLLRTYRFVGSLRSLAPVLVGMFTVAYFAATSDLASQKAFRADELSTYKIAVMPTAGGVWKAWFESPDGLPPAIHLTTHLVGSALGFSHVTARMPDMVGFWLMCVCIFIFLSRRVCPLLAWVGMLLPVTAPAPYFYAYEARGYGMVLAFSGAAIVCWDLAQHSRWRRVALFGLPICLTAAIATHLYAALVVVPLALAELTRTMERRKVDWWVWTGLVVVALWFLPANPVISRIRRLPWVVNYAVGRGLTVAQLMELSLQSLAIPAAYLGLLAIVCVCRDQVSGADNVTALSAREGQPPVSDWVLVAGLMALPAIGWSFANLVTGLLPFRYVIAAVIGFSLGVALLCRVAIGRRPEIALLLAAWMAIAAAVNGVATRYEPRTTTAYIAAGGGCFRLLKVWEKLPPDGLPIVVSEFTYFNQLHHYGPEALKQRLVFVVDRGNLGAQIESMTPFFTTVFGEDIEGLEQFVRSHRSFYLYDCGGPGKLPIADWLLGAGASLRDGGLVDTPDVQLRRELYRVSMPGGSAQIEVRR